MSPHGGTRPDRPVAAHWLSLRRPLDERARAGAEPLLETLAAHLRCDGLLHVFDIGAGTGANQEYLTPRLPVPSEWTLLDHDAALLGHPTQGPGRRVLAGVDELAALLGGHDGDRDCRLVTCSALLDLLTCTELAVMARTLAANAAPALLALSVTGGTCLQPPDPDDGVLATAFDEHQRRGDRPGPSAATLLRRHLGDLGMGVRSAQTPWQLSGKHPEALRRWLVDRAEASVEQRPELAGRARSWLDKRMGQAQRGVLTARVDHVDLLVLPRP